MKEIVKLSKETYKELLCALSNKVFSST